MEVRKFQQGALKMSRFRNAERAKYVICNACPTDTAAIMQMICMCLTIVFKLIWIFSHVHLCCLTILTLLSFCVNWLLVFLAGAVWPQTQNSQASLLRGRCQNGCEMNHRRTYQCINENGAYSSNGGLHKWSTLRLCGQCVLRHVGP